MNAIDTHILLYSVDRNDSAKQRKARELLMQLRLAGGWKRRKAVARLMYDKIK